MFQRGCSSSSHYTCIPTTQERGRETTAPTNVRPLMDRMCSQDPNLPKEGWRLNFYFGHFFFFGQLNFRDATAEDGELAVRKQLTFSFNPSED